ncbi:FtsB family cell division protein [Rhodocaloribacter sp.]
MARTKKAAKSPAPVRRWILLTAVALLGVWLLFFDSYSLWNSVAWRREHARLEAENAMLRQENAALERKVSEGLSEEVVERIAREQYGMRRPTETVYRIKVED